MAENERDSGFKLYGIVLFIVCLPVFVFTGGRLGWAWTESVGGGQSLVRFLVGLVYSCRRHTERSRRRKTRI
jgi:hypothetical protein